MMISAAEHERGGATVEFAVLIPAVCLVLALCLSGLQLAVHQLQLHDAAALAARSAGRGADPSAVVGQLVPAASMSSERRGNLVCVHLSTQGSPLTGLLGFGSVSASSCALSGGR